MANLLLIVSKDHPESFDFLRKAFGGRKDIDIIVDRRGGPVPVVGQDRRARKNDEQLRTHGWVLIRRLPGPPRPANGRPAPAGARAAVGTRTRRAKTRRAKRTVSRRRPAAKPRVAARKRRRRT
jgi:hypothetical protein